MRDWIERRPLLSFSLIAAVWLTVLYSGVLSAPFVYDDLDQIVRNPALQSWPEVYRHFILAPVSFTSGFLGNGGTTYRPVFWITLALDQHLWGSDAAGFHFTSLLLHAINGLLLFTLLRRLNLPTLIAGAASLVWLGLPIQTESIAWVSARAYPLSVFFLLLATLSALAYLRRIHWPPLILFFVFGALANFSHEQGVLLIAFLAFAYALAPQKYPPIRWVHLGLASLLADALYFLASHAVGSHAGSGPSTIWSAGELFCKYIQLIALPIHMSIERSTSVPVDKFSNVALLAWVALLAVPLIAFIARKHHPAIAAALGVLLIGLLPYCGFAFIYQGMAERFTYLASIGFALLLALSPALLKPMERTIAWSALALWMLWGGWRLVDRIDDWQQPEALYRHSLQATPRSAYLQDNLGVALRDAGDPQGALEAFQEAVNLRPDNASALTAIADLEASQGHPQKALEEYQRSLSLQPNDVKTVLNYAAALQAMRKNAEAEIQYNRAVSLLPHDSAAYVDLETLYIQEGRLDDAIRMYKQAVAVNPNDANAYFNLGVMFQQRGQDQEALAFYKKVLQLKPGDPTTLLYLGKLQGAQ